MPSRHRINGIDYLDFGSTTYTEGLNAVVFQAKSITIQEVADLESEGFFLHPLMMPDELDIFALKGTKEQFHKFLVICAEQDSIKKAVQLYGSNFEDENINKLREELVDELFNTFTPWYIK